MRRSQRQGALNFPTGPAENNYLITRLDPFHDKPFTPTGGPGCAPTVVRVYKRTTTFSAPTTGQKWSLCISNGPNGLPCMPTASTPTLNLRTFANGYGNATNGIYETSYAYGGLNAIATYDTSPTHDAQINGPVIYPTGPIQATAIASSNWQAAESVTVTAGTPTFNPAGSSVLRRRVAVFGEPVYTDGPSKLISVAYEVHMAASDLYNSGTVTIGRVPQSLQYGNIRVNTSGTAFSVYGSTSSAVLPTNASELLLYAGSKQWPAKYGVYCVAPGASSTSSDFDPTPFVNHNHRTQSWQDAQSNGTTTFSMCISTHLRDGSPFIASTEHFDTVMSMFEGLDPLATMTLTTSLIYETIPSDSEALRPLARLPHPMKPDIEELLCRMFSEVECFCMVNENASGKFFSKLRSGFNLATRVLGSKQAKTFIQAIPTTTPMGQSFKTAMLGLNTAAARSNRIVSKESVAGAKANGIYPMPAPRAATQKRRKARAVRGGPRAANGKAANPRPKPTKSA